MSAVLKLHNTDSITLYNANSKKEVISALQGLSFIDKLEAIKFMINLLNDETEKLIVQGMNDIAILKMSQVVMFEEVQMLIERASRGNM